MESGAPKVTGGLAHALSGGYAKMPTGYGFAQGRFWKGRHDVFTLCVSKRDFFDSFGSVPHPDYVMDWWWIVSFFDAAYDERRGNTGRLYIKCLVHYEDGQGANTLDPDNAQCAIAYANGLETSRWPVFAYSQGEHPHVDWDNMTLVIRDSITGQANHHDILVKIGDDTVQSYLNLTWTDGTRCVKNKVPADGDGYIKPGTWNAGVAAPANGTYQFINGAYAYDDLTANDWLGASHEDGNMGMYAIIQYTGQLAQRPTFMIFQGTGESGKDETLYPLAVSFGSNNWIDIYWPTPSGLNRTGVRNFVQGVGSYSQNKMCSFGEARIPWPWGHHRRCDDPTVLVPPTAADAGRQCLTAALYGEHEPHAGLLNDKGDLTTVFDKLERKTIEDDSESLDDLLVAVLRSDKGKGITIWGSWGMSEDDDYVEWCHRRLITTLAAGLLVQSEWIVHGLNDEGYENSPGVRGQANTEFIQYLKRYADGGAFSSKKYGVGYKVTDETTETDENERVARWTIEVSFRNVLKRAYITFRATRKALSVSATYGQAA